MSNTAKLFASGRSQAVRLPKEFRFEGREVFIRRNPLTDEVILTPKPESWTAFVDMVDKGGVPEDFMSDREQSLNLERDLF